MYSIGIINYINSIPLYHGLDAHCCIVKDTPRGLAGRFKRGELDVSFVPSVDYIRNKDWYIRVHGVSIASYGVVGSVFLIKKRGEYIASVRESGESITSNFIARVILDKKYGIRPIMLQEDKGYQADARIVIGDTALKNLSCADDEEMLDLGAEWYALTGLPLVYAVCVTRDAQTARYIGTVLTQTVRKNLSRLDAILAEHGAAMYGDYLRKINYAWSMRHDKSLSTLETLYRQDAALCTAK